MKNGHKNKGRNRKGTNTFVPKRKKEIVFDPEEREKYLRGFSDRKRERRAYGLAMQKIKDRKAKLEDRKTQKESELEQIEEAERQKKKLLKETLGRLEEDDSTNIRPKSLEEKVTTYEGEATEQQWGGTVIVTTTTEPLVSDDEELVDQDFPSTHSKRRDGIDAQQRYAGNVNKYINELKGQMPSKKNNNSHRPKSKGNHGAAAMKGMGGATNLKLAKKALTKANATEMSSTRRRKKRKR